jgi:hypothetical protein
MQRRLRTLRERPHQRDAIHFRGLHLRQPQALVDGLQRHPLASRRARDLRFLYRRR